MTQEDYSRQVREYVQQHRKVLGKEEAEIALANLRTVKPLTQDDADSRIASIDYHISRIQRVNYMMGVENDGR